MSSKAEADPPLPAAEADSPLPAAEARALGLLEQASAALVAGVEAALPRWAEREAARLGAAWGRWDPDQLAEVCRAAGEAGERAARRVARELAGLLALDPGAQRATPLQVIRTAVREPTAVLAAAGLPGVVRDDFDVASWPDDEYDLAPRALRDLDPELAAVHFAWGKAKAAVLRARSE